MSNVRDLLQEAPPSVSILSHLSPRFAFLSDTILGCGEKLGWMRSWRWAWRLGETFRDHITAGISHTSRVNEFVGTSTSSKRHMVKRND
jgi:hypothetical protein